jgi:hypothetical protein
VTRRGVGDDMGSAIVGVLAVGLVAVVVVASAAARLSAASESSRMSVAREQALLLAELGADAALAQLAENATARHLDVVAPPLGRVLSGSLQAADGTASYVVDVVGSGPLLRITSQATVGAAARAVEVDVRRRMTGDLLWMTDREVIDPALLGLPRGACDVPRQSGARDPACLDVSYGAADRFDGPFHSNDTLLLAGPAEFASTVTSADVHRDGDGRITTVPAGTGGTAGGEPGPFGFAHAPAVRLPERAADVLGGASPTCRFRGPTLLRFDGHAVRITSPLSVPTPEDGPAGPAGIGCAGVDLSALAAPTTVVLPASTVIEIVDADGCNGHPLGLTVAQDRDRVWHCDAGDAFVWGRYLGARTVLAAGSVMLLWDVEPGTAASPADPSTSDAMLGLVATDSIVVRRLVGPPLAVVAPYGRNLPVSAPDVAPFGAYPADAPTPVASTWEAPRIVASLVALRGGFGIQNPFVGQEHAGSVHVIGSVAQRFHGVHRWELRNRTGSVVARTGYDLEVTYDRRLVTSAPPALPSTRSGRFRVLRIEEVRPVPIPTLAVP